MGAITSRQVIDSPKNKSVTESHQQPSTPINDRILPFDPRSPSENVIRTPIAISDPSNTNETPKLRSLKALPIDPRSPTIEITRTPLIVKDLNEKEKPHLLRPSKLAEIALKNATVASSTKDPRSPTEKVPRTPLEEEGSNTDELPSEPHERGLPTNLRLNLKDTSIGSIENDRRPLTDVQNTTPTQPKTRMQESRSENVEEEFVNNEKSLIRKLDGQDSKTSTEFVENI